MRMACSQDLLLSAILASCLLVGINSPLVSAQESPPQIENEPESEVDSETEPPTDARPIEEITVQGRKTTYSLRMEIESLEEEVFGMFNELNSNDEFDVKCTREVYAGSCIPKRVCMTAFLRKEVARHTQDYLTASMWDHTSPQLTGSQVKNEVYQKSVAMDVEMTRLAQENQAFFDALQKLTNLVGELGVKKAERYSFFK